MLEAGKEIKLGQHELEEIPPRPKMHKKERPHRQTTVARKKYVIADINH